MTLTDTFHSIAGIAIEIVVFAQLLMAHDRSD